jgi:hypothetical protein
VLPVKFDGRLSNSVLRNKQLFKKIDVKSSHFFNFATLQSKKRTDLGKRKMLHTGEFYARRCKKKKMEVGISKWTCA